MQARGRGAQYGQVAHVPEIMIRVTILERVSGGLIVQRRWRRDVKIGYAEGLAVCEGDIGLLV